jgi:hypothetical protein
MMQAKRCVHCMALLKEGGDCPDCGKRQRDRAFSDQHLPLLSTLGSRYQTGLCILQNERMICYTALDMDRQAPCVLCEYFPKDVVYRIHATAHVACLSKADEAVFAKGMNTFQAGAKKQAAAAAAGIAIPIISTFQQNNTVYAGLDMQGLSTLHDQLSFSGLPISHAKARDILIQALYVLQTLHQCNLAGLEISEGSLCMHQNAWKLWYIEKSANLQDIPAAKAAALENPLAADLYQLGMLVCYLVTGKTFDPNLDDNQAIWYHQLYEVILWRPWLEKLLFPEKAGAFQSIGEAIAAVKEAPAVSAASLRQEEIRMVQVGLGTPRNIPKTATVDKRQSSPEKGRFCGLK